MRKKKVMNEIENIATTDESTTLKSDETSVLSDPKLTIEHSPELSASESEKVLSGSAKSSSR